MRDEIKNFFLLVDASPTDAEYGDESVHRRAAVSFARIVRNRGQRLIVKADAATTTAILLATAEYYQGAVVEQENPASLQFLHVIAPITRSTELADAEGNWFSAEQRRGPDEKLSGLDITLGHLATWANAVDSREEGNVAAGFQFVSEDLVSVFRRFPPSLIVTLGSSDELEEPLRAALASEPASYAKLFFDGRSDAVMQRDPIRLENVLADGAFAFRWDRSSLIEGRDEKVSVDVDYHIWCAEKEAKLHVAFELLVSRELHPQ